MTLRASERPVNQKGVGANFARDTGSQPNGCGSQSLTQAKDPLEARKSNLYLLPHSAPPLCSLGGQQEANLSQSLLQILAPVGQISQKPPRYAEVGPSPKAASLMSPSLRAMFATFAE